LQDILAVARRKFRDQDQVIDCQPLDGLRSLEAAAATGNEVVSMGCKHQSCCWRILALPDVASIVGSSGN